MPRASTDRKTPSRHDESTLLADVVLRLGPGVDRVAVFEDLGVTPVDVLEDGLTWRVLIPNGVAPASVFAAAGDDGRVEMIEPNALVTVPESAQSSIAFSEGNADIGDFWDQNVSERLGLTLAHGKSTGRGVTVAVLDTGLNPSHPVFLGRVARGGYDFVDNDNEPFDLPDGLDNDGDGMVDEAAGHGCHVAGLVSLVAPAAQILPVRVLNSDGVGTVYGVARGIKHAVDHGAEIINLSLSMSLPSDVVSEAIGYAASRGVILVCAAGNTHAGGGTGALNYPADDGRVWAVGALTRQGTPSSFSAPGPFVAFSAPGENLLSAYLDDGYASWSGTSMASPLAAGTAALFLAANRAERPDHILANLAQTVQPVAGDHLLVGAGQVHPGRLMSQLTGGDDATGIQKLPRKGN